MTGNGELIEELRECRVVTIHCGLKITPRKIEEAIAEIERLNEVIRFAGIEVTGPTMKPEEK